MRGLALACALMLAGAASADPYLLYGHGEAGDGLGYGFRNARVTTRGPWGRYDQSAPGYRAHGMRFSTSFYGRTENDPSVTFVGVGTRRGDHPATLTYDRSGRPVYLDR